MITCHSCGGMNVNSRIGIAVKIEPGHSKDAEDDIHKARSFSCLRGTCTRLQMEQDSGSMMRLGVRNEVSFPASP